MNRFKLFHIQDLQRFVIGGVLNNLFSYTTYLLLKFLMDYQVAYFLAYIAGIIFSYGFNTKMVFKVKQSLKTLSLYPLVYIFMYIVAAGLLNFLVNSVGINDIVAPLILAVAVVPFTFVMTKVVLHR